MKESTIGGFSEDKNDKINSMKKNYKNIGSRKRG